jgi:pyruvate formate lyase activating enzyme
MSRVECDRCFRKCSIPEGERGACWIIGNEGGEAKLLAYGMVSTAAIGPIEEKGIFHFHPGMEVLSIGGYGCNLRCKFCQNYEISQTGVQDDAENLSPAMVVAMAKKQGARGIAFTYSEPLLWTEYVIDVFRAAREAGLYRILKTAGAASEEVFRAVMAETDAVNIDFKGDIHDHYERICGVSWESRGAIQIANNIIAAEAMDVHLEMTVLVYGDSDLDDEGSFGIDIGTLWQDLDTNHDIPIHLVIVLPNYRMSGPPPSMDDMTKAAVLAGELFCNVFVHEPDFSNDTKCLSCGETIITRKGLEVESNKVIDGACPLCNPLPWERVWKEPKWRDTTTSAETAS